MNCSLPLKHKDDQTQCEFLSAMSKHLGQQIGQYRLVDGGNAYVHL
jgi:hypothetical protein